MAAGGQGAANAAGAGNRIPQLRIGGLLVGSDAFFAAQRELLVALAAQHALPAIYAYR
jgi:hypothetical protein